MTIKKMYSKKTQHGFSLLEVMIALVIFSIGLIGLAGLQSASLSYNHGAYLRTQANYLAYNILDKMRANPERAAAGAYVNAYTDTGTNHACYYSSTASCSFTDLVDTDIFEWKQAMSNLLPGGQGKIELTNSTTGIVHVITVEWDDPISSTGKTTLVIRSES